MLTNIFSTFLECGDAASIVTAQAPDVEEVYFHVYTDKRDETKKLALHIGWSPPDNCKFPFHAALLNSSLSMLVLTIVPISCLYMNCTTHENYLTYTHYTTETNPNYMIRNAMQYMIRNAGM